MNKILFAIVLWGFDVFAMSAQPTRVVLWRRGETIGGEEFIVANEAIVDYIATLKRPTEILKGIKYNCMAKTRTIQPTVTQTPTTTTGTAYVYVTTVYELRDCNEAFE